jgi:hypothetical protein
METSERRAEIKDLGQLIADDTSPAQRIKYRAAEAQAESDRLATVAKAAADKAKEWDAYEVQIPGYPYLMDRHGAHIPAERKHLYRVVGTTSLMRCLIAQSRHGVLG